jgi:hypothetical protein
LCLSKKKSKECAKGAGFFLAAENLVIWPKTGYFGHYYQERYLLDDFMLIQN